MQVLTRSTQWLICLLLLIGLLPLFLLNKGEIVQWMNQTYSPTSVYFFRAINMLGDGILFAIIGIPLLLFSYRKAILLIFMIIIQTIIVRMGKDWLAEGWSRPFKYFQERGVDLQVADGVIIKHIDTFPSGHATTAFTLAFFFLFIFEKKQYQIPIFLVFTIAAFARVYLAQHFYVDIYAGLLAAITTAFIASLLYEKWKINNLKEGLLTGILSRNR